MGSTRYTVRDMIKLSRYLNNVSFEIQVLDRFKKNMVERPVSSEEIEIALKNYLESHFTGGDKIARFVFECPLRETIKYVNDDIVALFLRWRLDIRK